MKFNTNCKAPRLAKHKYATIVFNKELYKKFKEKFPEYEKMPWKEFKQRWEEIAETIRSEAIMNPLGVKLSFYLGELKYQFLPYKYEAIDEKASIEAQEKIKHMNLTTRGKVGKVKWERRIAVNFNKILQFYGFEEDKRMRDLCKQYTLDNPEKIRIARNTLGRKSFGGKK